MGVNGLWQLVSPVARPIQLETLAGRRLAIDASIWMYQFQMAMRDKKTGDPLQGAHIMGTFRRILKLLFHGIKPVFVFDGDAPMLKKRTIAERKRRKAGATRDLAKTAQQLLSAQLRAAAANNALNRAKKKAMKDSVNQEEEGDIIDENAVYLDDLDPDTSPRRTSQSTSALPAADPSPKKFIPKDQYALPSIDGPLESRAKASDPRIATEEELREFIEDMRPEDFDIDSDFFGNLPVEVKYEIIGDLRIKSRQVNHKRVESMRKAATPLDFSKAQITNLMERNTLTQKLLSVTDALGQSPIAIPTRVAGERNREYLLVKQDDDKGGGWVLGVRDPVVKNKEAIVINSSDESSESASESDDFEEVGIPATAQRSPSPDVEARRTLAVEAIRARYAPDHPAPEADPYLDQPAKPKGPALFHSGSSRLRASTSRLPVPQPMEVVDDDETDDLQAAIRQSMLTAEIEASERSIQVVDELLFGSSTSAPTKDVLEEPLLPAANMVEEDPGNESEESLEYVDPPSRLVAVASPPPVQVLTIDDSEDSDDFEEVEVSKPQAEPVISSSSQLVSTGAVADFTVSAPQLPSIAVLDRPASTTPPPPSVRANSVALPYPHSASLAPEDTAMRRPAHAVPARTKMSIMDSILPSDSDSESDFEEVISSTLPTIPHHSSPPPNSSKSSTVTNPLNLDEDEADDEEPTFVRFNLPKPAQDAPITQSLSTQVDDASLKRETDESTAPVPSNAETRHNGTTFHIRQPAGMHTVVNVPTKINSIDKEDVAPFRKGVVDEAMGSDTDEIHTELVSGVDSKELPMEIGTEQAFEETVEASEKKEEEEEEEEEEEGEGEGEGDIEEFFEWERSPTPPARDKISKPLFEPPDYDEEPEFVDEDDQEMENLEREADHYASMISQLKNRRLEDVRQEAEKEITTLRAQRNVDQRNADGVTRQMASDLKDLLSLFGIPYVDAPQEAEAECAELFTRQLVDGIVTDDSDVFLFGGGRIYRNMFNDNKYVECYLLSDLERELGLDRTKLIALAYLLGGDYTEGIPGVGPVSARELLEDFRGNDPLKDFREWWMKVQSGKDTEEDTGTPFRRRFKKGHRTLVLEPNWPDPNIARAYYHPSVNEDDTAFFWGGPDLDGLRSYLGNALSWSASKTDEALLPLIRRQNERKAGTLKVQGRISDYFDPTAGTGPLTSREKRVGYASERLQNIVQSWRKKQRPTQSNTSPGSDQDDEILLPPRPLKRVKPNASEVVAVSSSTTLSRSPSASSGGPSLSQTAPSATAPGPNSISHVQAQRKTKATQLQKKRRPKSTPASRKRANEEWRDARAAARGGVYSSEDEGLQPTKKSRAPRKLGTSEKGKRQERAVGDGGLDREEEFLAETLRKRKERQAMRRQREEESDG